MKEELGYLKSLERIFAACSNECDAASERFYYDHNPLRQAGCKAKADAFDRAATLVRERIQWAQEELENETISESECGHE